MAHHTKNVDLFAKIREKIRNAAKAKGKGWLLLR